MSLPSLPLCQEPGPLVAPFFGSGGQQVAHDEKFSAENDSGDEEEEEEEEGGGGGSRRRVKEEGREPSEAGREQK